MPLRPDIAVLIDEQVPATTNERHGGMPSVVSMIVLAARLLPDDQ